MIEFNKLKELFEYIDYIHNNTEKLTIKENLTKEELILQNLACLTEEVGEVSAEIRKLTKMSFNKKKVDSFCKKDLEDEIIDVLITTFLLTKSAGINDISDAINRKILKNKNRGY